MPCVAFTHNRCKRTKIRSAPMPFQAYLIMQSYLNFRIHLYLERFSVREKHICAIARRAKIGIKVFSFRFISNGGAFPTVAKRKAYGKIRFPL